MTKIGIRREDISKWERRTPLVPEHIKNIINESGIEVVVQPSDTRVFTAKQFEEVGAIVSEDLSECSVIFAVKEIPSNLFIEKTAYLFFAHVIKGQKYNMGMLQKMIDKKCTLIDYEKIIDDAGRRLIFFGKFAGNAGMIDSLSAYSQRLDIEKIPNPLNKIKKTLEYENLIEAEKAIYNVGREISEKGLPIEICPLVIGFAGYGNVSKGAQEICNCLPIIEISPEELLELRKSGRVDRYHIYKVVFKEKDMVTPKNSNDKFELQDYYDNPHKYNGDFHKYIDHINILINCIYWEEKYPRLLTKAYTKKIFSGDKQPELKVIGDISCDIGGAIECTMKATKPDKPNYTYLVDEDIIVDGIEGKGPVIMAVTNLPCEIPAESSTAFSSTLFEFVPEITSADYEGEFKDLKLSKSIKDAVILFKGEFTENYKYIKKFL